MAILKLSATPREETGSRASQKLRSSGFIPASLYAGGEQPMLLSLETKKWGKHITGQLNLVNIQFASGGEQVAAVREIQRDPLSQEVIHVDFFKVSMDKETEFHVALRLDGIPLGVKDGGVQSVMAEYIQVECLPTIVPDEIPVDISGLQIGQNLNAGQIVLPEGIKLISDPDLTIISVTHIRVVVEEVKAEEEEAVEGAEEGEKKPEGESKKAPYGESKKAPHGEKKS